jgi:hypothetical protein
VEHAIQRFHYDFWRTGQGIADALMATLRQRFFQDNPNADIPSAWLYWAITAGGLGLHQPLIDLVSQDVVPPPGISSVLTSDDTFHWSRMERGHAELQRFRMVHGGIREVKPTPSKVMETHVEDFVKRGGEISAQKIQKISNYWHWILYTYGPQILDKFGTFRFLITELVPVQLILQRRMGVTSAIDNNTSGTDFANTGEIPF